MMPLCTNNWSFIMMMMMMMMIVNQQLTTGLSESSWCKQHNGHASHTSHRTNRLTVQLIDSEMNDCCILVTRGSVQSTVTTKRRLTHRTSMTDMITTLTAASTPCLSSWHFRYRMSITYCARQMYQVWNSYGPLFSHFSTCPVWALCSSVTPQTANVKFN